MCTYTAYMRPGRKDPEPEPKPKTKPPRISYAYFKTDIYRKNRWYYNLITTIAYEWVPGEGLWFAPAFCSPEDNFCRAEGRKIAEDRLAHGDCVFLPSISSKVPPGRQIKKIIATHIFNVFHSPLYLPGRPHSWDKIVLY